MSIPQEIRVTRNLEEDDGAIMFFYCWQAVKNYFKLLFRFVDCNRIIQKSEHQKILRLLNEPNDSKFVTRKWNIVNVQSNANYDAGKK